MARGVARGMPCVAVLSFFFLHFYFFYSKEYTISRLPIFANRISKLRSVGCSRGLGQNK